MGNPYKVLPALVFGLALSHSDSSAQEGIGKKKKREEKGSGHNVVSGFSDDFLDGFHIGSDCGD